MEIALAPEAAATAVAPARHRRPAYKDALTELARPRVARSVVDVLTSAVPYLALSVAMVFAMDVSYWLVLALIPPAAGFLVRTFIVFHDCAHGSFLPSKRGNQWLGRVMALLVFTPYMAWRHDHAVHHATAGDLDRRGVGDLPTLTVQEYRERSRLARIAYRLFRNPMVMFTVGPIFSMIILPRIARRSQRPRVRNSILLTNVVLAVVVGALVWLIGWQAYLFTQGPTVLLAGAAGVWLFYVQHQFEDTYWQDADSWSYEDAALRGSSYLKLPAVLQFFTGNIGLHHVHHLSSRVPNYNLQRAHDTIPVFHEVPVLSLWDGLRAVRLKLWDAERGRLVTWREEKASR
jgi:omega-6 fatty acid desaturase (delta-12 desaturase)